MSIFDRLGDVLRSYLNDAGSGPSGGSSGRGRYADPDLEAAYEELDDFLEGGKDGFGAKRSSSGKDRWADFRGGGENTAGRKTPPESLRNDFVELGLDFGASADMCKTAYKRLLKLHHPDRHAGHEGNMRKATAKSARINAAYDRIERWRETGKTD